MCSTMCPPPRRASSATRLAPACAGYPARPLGTAQPVVVLPGLCHCVHPAPGGAGSPPTLARVLGRRLQPQSRTAGPQVPAMPPQGPQCPSTLNSIPSAQSRQERGCSLLQGCWPWQPCACLWQPPNPPASLTASPASRPANPTANPTATSSVPKTCSSQKWSIPPHCNLLVPPSHLQASTPSTALMEQGGPPRGWLPGGLQETDLCQGPNQPKNVAVVSEHDL